MGSKPRPVTLLGVPTRYGTAYPGSEATPLLLRQRGVFARLAAWAAAQPAPAALADAGDVPVPEAPWTAEGFPLRALAPALDVAERQAARVEALVQQGRAPLVLGGDCTTLLGTAAGLRRAGRRFGLICLDAHGDFNTPATTPSGNLHGMTVAALAGRGAPELLALYDGGVTVPPQRITLLGVRDLDPPEAVALREAGVLVLSPAALRCQGPAAVGCQALKRALADDVDGILLHLDLDVLDPMVAPGVGLPVPGGLTHDELRAALAPILASRRLLAAELTEAAPVLDPEGPTLGVVEELLRLLASALAESHACP